MLLKVLLVLEIAWSVGWYGLSQNKPLKEVLRWGVACGSAATMNEGQLFKLEDAKRLFEWVNKQ
jgi:6-phosphofructokinase 2